MHISTNDLHCFKPVCLMQWAPSGGRPRLLPSATAPPRIDPTQQQRQTALEDRWQCPAPAHISRHSPVKAKVRSPLLNRIFLLARTFLRQCLPDVHLTFTM
jgi:hypothetical protein